MELLIKKMKLLLSLNVAFTSIIYTCLNAANIEMFVF